MTGLSVELTAPNGRKYVQPTGLFIDNEWVEGSGGEMITSINPSYVHFFFFFFFSLGDSFRENFF